MPIWTHFTIWYNQEKSHNSQPKISTYSIIDADAKSAGCMKTYQESPKNTNEYLVPQKSRWKEERKLYPRKSIFQKAKTHNCCDRGYNNRADHDHPADFV
jgi:hypothetical protein